MESLRYSGSDALDLGDQRLLVSSNLGTEFTNLLEVDHIDLSEQEQEELRKILEEISKENTSKSKRVIHTNSIKVSASLLRAYKPNMIIGTKGKDSRDVLKQIGSQLGLPPALSVTDMISDRLTGREKVAILILNCDESAKIEKGFKRIPENGILVFNR